MPPKLTKRLRAVDLWDRDEEELARSMKRPALDDTEANKAASRKDSMDIDPFPLSQCPCYDLSTVDPKQECEQAYTRVDGSELFYSK